MLSFCPKVHVLEREYSKNIAVRGCKVKMYSMLLLFLLSFKTHVLSFYLLMNVSVDTMVTSEQSNQSLSVFIPIVQDIFLLAYMLTRKV